MCITRVDTVQGDVCVPPLQRDLPPPSFRNYEASRLLRNVGSYLVIWHEISEDNFRVTPMKTSNLTELSLVQLSPLSKYLRILHTSPDAIIV